MVSTPEPLTRAELQATGENVNVWGVNLDAVIQRLAENSSQYTAVAVTSPSTALTALNYVADQARSAILKFTGTLTANTTIVTPNVAKVYVALNACSGAFTLSLQTGAIGTAVALRAGVPTLCFSDGTNWTKLDLTLDQILTAAANVSFGGVELQSIATTSTGSSAVNNTRLSAAIASASIPAATGAVKNTVSDTSANYLAAKLAALGAVVLTTLNPGGNEQTQISLSVASAADVDAGTDNAKPITALALIGSARETRGIRRARNAAFFA
jgi:hypothetical protein